MPKSADGSRGARPGATNAEAESERASIVRVCDEEGYLVEITHSSQQNTRLL